MKILLTIVFAILITDVSYSQDHTYPKTRKTNQTDTYFGTVVSDPYRWLEDDHSEETAEWVKEQNIITNKFLMNIPYRDKVKERMKQHWNFPKFSSPSKSGNNFFIYTNNGLQNQFVLNIIRGGFKSTPEVFIDPNTLSEDGTVNMSSTSVSHDGKFLAYSISRAGSDWQEIYIKNTLNGNQFNDKISWVKFSGISWKDKGFYYSRYDAPDSTSVKKGKNEFHKVYYHHAGNPQKYDRLIYEDKKNPLRNFYAGVTENQDYLYIIGSQGTSGNNLIVQDLNKVNSPFVTLVDGFDKDYSVVDNDSSKFYVLTNSGADKYRLVMINSDDPKAPWVDIISEREDVLQEVVVGNNILIARYMKDAISVLKMFSKTGAYLGDIPLASIGTVDQISSAKNDANLFFSLTSFTSPSVIYHFDLNSKKSEVFFKPKIDFAAADYETKQVFYESKDGTRVPMFITHKKGLVMDGSNPTLLFAYGGFNVPQLPICKIERLVFLENGGVYAQPCIRGGGEYGEEWHLAGSGLRKQNTFDDFIAAAEYLVREKYTAASKLAISGRSNGGLLVGAVMTQRPELFKVAIPVVGVLDMLRYHTFTIGWAWKTDYGSSEDEPNFRNLYAYSPLHNVKEVDYPATLVITGDHDDRVVPAHSFKFIAALQEKNRGNNPMMIRIDINSGHASTTALGSSKPVSKQIDEQSDIFSFIMYNLKMHIK